MSPTGDGTPLPSARSAVSSALPLPAHCDLQVAMQALLLTGERFGRPPGCAFGTVLPKRGAVQQRRHTSHSCGGMLSRAAHSGVQPYANAFPRPPNRVAIPGASRMDLLDFAPTPLPTGKLTEGTIMSGTGGCDSDLEFTPDGERKLGRRHIPKEWIRFVIANHNHREARFDGTTLYVGVYHGHRLKVVVDERCAPPRFVTAYEPEGDAP